MLSLLPALFPPANNQYSFIGFNACLNKPPTTKNKGIKTIGSGNGICAVTIAQDSRLTLELLLDKFDDDFDAYSLTGDYHTTNNESGDNYGHLVSPILTWEREFGKVKLTSITNYSHSNYGFLHDWDFSRYDAVTGEYEDTYKTLTQDCV